MAVLNNRLDGCVATLDRKPMAIIFSQVCPAPYDKDPAFLAMDKCSEIEKRFDDDNARSNQDPTGNE